MIIADAHRESFVERAAFAKVRKAENDYARRLRKIAQHIHDLVHGFVTREPGYPVDVAHLEHLLTRYSHIVEPWARAVAGRFLNEVSRRDEQAWATYAKKFSRALEAEIRSAPTGQMLQQFLETQVQLITSLPLQAAQRVHEIVIGNTYSGARYTEVAEHLMQTGEVTRSRANLIARTESSRVASALTMVRAQHIGGEGYVWRTMQDPNVRPNHRKMEGKFIRWDAPPEVDPGKNYHAGMTYNCRCFPEPIIPERYLAAA